MQELPENFNFDDLEGSVNVQEKAQQDIRDFISSILDKKELKIVSLLFGLEPPYKPLTLKEASSLLHLNSETVRLTRSRALDKIKEHQNQIAELV
jgi:DNA-directed RNA polymerase sigma subunit (sigma70/sigma32)